MAQLISDSFAVNAASLGANWTEDQHGFSVATDAISESQFAENTAFYSGAGWTGGADGYAEVTLAQLSATSSGGPSYRSVTGQIGYYFFVNHNWAAPLGGSVSCALYMANGGALGIIGSAASTTVNVGDVARIECNGTSIVGKINGAPICSVTEATLSAAGKPGIAAVWLSGVTVNYSLFAAGDLSGGVTMTPAQKAAVVTGNSSILGFKIHLPGEIVP